LKSRVGEGTTAELWLPVAEETITTIERKRPLLAGAAKRYNLSVMLAEDDDNLVLTNTVAMLEDLARTAWMLHPAVLRWKFSAVIVRSIW
jgi:hypothetical protein